MKRPRLASLLLPLLVWMGSALCLSAAASHFRVATFNLDNYLLETIGTRPAKPASARDKIRETLHALRADVLALQEVGGQPALRELRDSLKTEGLDYPHWELITGFDTNIQVAVLSRFPIVRRRPHTNDAFLLMGRRFRVSRGFLEVDIQIHPGYHFTLFTAHLKSRRPVGFADEAEMREEEARLLRSHVEARLQQDPQTDLVVLGDFNDFKSSPAIRALIGRGRETLIDTRPAEPNGDNQPNPDPRYDPRNITWTQYYGKEDTYSRIDYIFISPGLVGQWIQSETFIQTLPNWGVASDHRALAATFTVPHP